MQYVVNTKYYLRDIYLINWKPKVGDQYLLSHSRVICKMFKKHYSFANYDIYQSPNVKKALLQYNVKPTFLLDENVMTLLLRNKNSVFRILYIFFIDDLSLCCVEYFFHQSFCMIVVLRISIFVREKDLSHVLADPKKFVHNFWENQCSTFLIFWNLSKIQTFETSLESPSTDLKWGQHPWG